MEELLIPKDDNTEATEVSNIVEIVNSMFISTLVNKRGGVVLWCLQLSRWIDACTSSSIFQDVHQQHASDSMKEISSLQKKWSEVLGAVVMKVWMLSCEEASSATGQSGINKMIAAKLAAPAITPAAAPTAAKKGSRSAAPPVQEHSGDTAQALVAKQMEVILRLNGTPVCRQLITAISLLPSEALLHVCKSGPISRAVLDTFLDVCRSGSENMRRFFTSFLVSCCMFHHKYT